MKKEIYRNNERGSSNLNWLKSKFSFSFANYYNPNKMGFGALRVLNDDIISPGKGFGDHPHDNMEIITIVTEGELEHKDNVGGKSVIKAGDVQVMSAGSGIVHSEFNHSKTKEVKLFQLWIESKKEDIEPRYDQKKFDIGKNNLTLVVSGEKSKNNLYIHQDAKILLGKFEKKEVEYNFNKNNGVYVFVIDGSLIVNNEKLEERDAIGITKTNKIEIKTDSKSYFMVIEVPCFE